mmetsp:Transcript_28334/g.94155  ORF Transcript_28334/g.94155 Transcript_28334/m.94155 type:complete len:206 (+) Transcript_28334:259-876(+)
MLQVAKALLVDVADEELAAAQPEELVAIPAYLGVYANLEEENVIVGVRLPAAASRLVATALAEGSSSRGVELAWSRRKDDPRRALAWKPAQRRADLPLQISAAVVACASAVHIGSKQHQNIAVHLVAQPRRVEPPAAVAHGGRIVAIGRVASRGVAPRQPPPPSLQASAVAVDAAVKAKDSRRIPVPLLPAHEAFVPIVVAAGAH